MIPLILNDNMKKKINENNTELTPTTTALVIIIIKRFTKHLVLLKENINRHRSCYLGIQNFEELEVQGLVPISSQSCGGETDNQSAVVWQ